MGVESTCEGEQSTVSSRYNRRRFGAGWGGGTGHSLSTSRQGLAQEEADASAMTSLGGPRV